MTKERTDAPEPRLTADQWRRVWRVIRETLRPPERTGSDVAEEKI